CGLGRVAHTEVGTTYSYWPWTDGIVYWNETMPPFEAANQHRALAYENLPEDVNYIGWTQDVNNNGVIDLLTDLLSYRELGISTMPNISIGPDNQIFVVWSSATETYDNGTYNYKHVWVRRSPDGGTTWGNFYDLNTDLIHIFDECIYPVMAEQVDDGVHIIYQADATPGTALDEDHPYQENRMIYVKRYINEFTDMEEHEGVIGESLVSQNYPNPFTNWTMVQVQTLARSDLKVEVTNLMGQMVKEIDMGVVNAGLHNVRIEAADMTPGIYFYTVKVGENAITRKMIVE
ncbi:MAG: T9SS type A sorting domain-containing protein, partial [Bacteroidales bacterium]|nr:T9SS type A sorting domain-containing protein [Bacteroidales bacterium]